MTRRTRLYEARHPPRRPDGTPRQAIALTTPQPSGFRSWLGLLIAVPMLLCMVTWLIWSQAQIARVLLGGVPGQGTVVAVNQCDRATAGSVTIIFTDVHGQVHRESHSSYTPGCFTTSTYHVGDDVAFRYVPADPGVLMTQTEIARLPFSFVIFGLADVLFVGGPLVVFVVIGLPWAASRASRLRGRLRGLSVGAPPA